MLDRPGELWQRFQLALISRLHPRLPQLDRPIFILGCGRSGTTILGKLMATHPSVHYLNEPRFIWLLDRKTDIWSARAAQRHGRLHLTNMDLPASTASRLRRRFAADVIRNQGDRLVEKLPINSFRVEYVDALYPDALFVHLLRNGRDVAASIAAAAERGAWYVNPYKWQQLAGYAESQGLGALVPLCDTAFRKGLLEWRLAVETCRLSLSKLAPQRWTELRYEHLLAAPAEMTRRLEEFAGLAPDPGTEAFAVNTISVQRHSEREYEWDVTCEEIAGALLQAEGYHSGSS